MNPYEPVGSCCQSPNSGNDFYSICAALALIVMCVSAFLHSIKLVEFEKPWIIFDSPILGVIILVAVATTAFYCGRYSKGK